jgi:hypothetical protein
MVIRPPDGPVARKQSRDRHPSIAKDAAIVNGKMRPGKQKGG